MKWLNIKFILYTFLGLLCVTSGLFRNHTNGNNAPSKSVANMHVSTVKQVVHIGIEKYGEMLNGDSYQNCGVKNFRKGKPLSAEDEILIQEAEREAYNVKINALIQAALSNFREIDYIMESIFDPENVCNEFSADTFNNILEYRNILSSVLHRLYICDVTSITRKMANRRKPDYGYVFSTDLTTGKGVIIYAEIKKDPSQSKILHTILGLLDNTVSLIKKIPEMCNRKWFIEKTIECLNLYECNYVHGFTNGLDEQWFRYEDAEKNHDEEEVVGVIVDDNTHKDAELTELME